MSVPMSGAWARIRGSKTKSSKAISAALAEHLPRGEHNQNPENEGKDAHRTSCLGQNRLRIGRAHHDHAADHGLEAKEDVGRRGITGFADEQGKRRHKLHQRRVFGIDAEIGVQPVPIARVEMRRLIEGLRFLPGGEKSAAKTTKRAASTGENHLRNPSRTSGIEGALTTVADMQKPHWGIGLFGSGRVKESRIERTDRAGKFQHVSWR